MSEITVQELNDLQEQKAIYEKQLSALDINNPIHAIERSALTDEINVVSNKISEKKWEMQQKEAQIEEKVHSEGVPFAVSGVDFTQLPADLITVIELVVKADRRRIYAQWEADKAAEKAKYESDVRGSSERYDDDINERDLEINSLKEDIEHNDKVVSAFNAQVNEQVGIIAQKDLEIADFQTKLANAAAQLDEAKAEIERQKSEIADYQKAKVFGEREAQSVIEAEPQEADAINAALKKLYVSYENWGSTNKVVKPDGTFELVKNADLHEWVPETEVANTSTPSPGESGQTAEADVENGGVPDSGAITPPQLPFPALSNGDTAVEGQSADGDMVAKELTIIERITGLEERVKRLEQVA